MTAKLPQARPRGIQIFLLGFLVCVAGLLGAAPTVNAQITVKDYLQPLLDEYAAMDAPGPQELELLAYRYEFVYAKELGDLFYDRLTHDRKWGLREAFADYAASFPEIIPTLAAKRAEVLEIIPATEARFVELFGLQPEFPVYFFATLAPTDGKVTHFGGRRGFALNFNKIRTYSATGTRILLGHEFFHLFQAEYIEEPEGPELPPEPTLGSLMAEGWATYASEKIFPGFEAWQYVSPFAGDDQQFRAFQEYKGEMLGYLLANLDNTDRRVWARLFSGNPEDAAPWPPRGGYYLGYLLAKQMSADRSWRDVLLMPYRGFREIAETELRSLAK